MQECIERGRKKLITFYILSYLNAKVTSRERLLYDDRIKVELRFIIDTGRM